MPPEKLVLPRDPDKSFMMRCQFGNSEVFGADGGSGLTAQHPNYHQLLYFWAVVREGGVLKAAEALHVTPQTISGQLKLLQAQVNGRLLIRVGRGLKPTDLGRSVFRLAEDIFPRGLELGELIRSGSPRGPQPLLVGVADALPDTAVCRLIAPALDPSIGARLVCREGPLEALLSDVGAHRLDVVLSTSALPSSSPLRGSSHLLAECDVAFFAAPTIARRLKGRFPDNLGGAPWLLPAAGTAVRRSLDAWFGRHGIIPAIAAEVDSSHLMRALAGEGLGVFCAPADIGPEIVENHRMVEVGRTDEIRARIYAVTLERRTMPRALSAILSHARSQRGP